MLANCHPDINSPSHPLLRVHSTLAFTFVVGQPVWAVIVPAGSHMMSMNQFTRVHSTLAFNFAVGQPVRAVIIPARGHMMSMTSEKRSNCSHFNSFAFISCDFDSSFHLVLTLKRLTSISVHQRYKNRLPMRTRNQLGRYHFHLHQRIALAQFYGRMTTEDNAL